MGILDPASQIADVVITSEGRKQLAAGTFKISYASVTDTGVVYSAPVSGSYDVAGLAFIEQGSSPHDLVTLESDDSGKLAPLKSETFNLVGSRIFSTGSLDSITDELTALPSVNLSRQRILMTVNKDFGDDGFAAGPSNVSFTVTQESPVSYNVVEKIEDHDSLFEDPDMSTLDNFSYMPPIDRDGDKLGVYKPSGEATRKKTVKDVRLEMKSYPSKRIVFDPTTVEGNIIMQSYEYSGGDISKLQARVFSENPLIVFLGKTFTDANGCNNFVRIFCLEFSELKMIPIKIKRQQIFVIDEDSYEIESYNRSRDVTVYSLNVKLSNASKFTGTISAEIIGGDEKRQCSVETITKKVYKATQAAELPANFQLTHTFPVTSASYEIQNNPLLSKKVIDSQIDPAKSTFSSKKIISIAAARKGTSVVPTGPKSLISLAGIDDAVTSANIVSVKSASDLEPDHYVSVLDEKTTKIAHCRLYKYGKESFTISISAKDDRNVVVDSYEIVVNHQATLVEFLSPKLEPTVDVRRIGSDHVINVTSKERENIESFELYSRKLDDIQASDYTFITSQSAVNGMARFIVSAVSNGRTIYRAVPVGYAGSKKNIFGSGVISTDVQDSEPSFMVKYDALGVRIDTFRLPKSAVSFAIVKRKLNSIDQFEYVSEFRSVSDFSYHESVYDTNVKQWNSYEYAIRYYTVNGVMRTAGSYPHYHLPVPETKLDIRVENEKADILESGPNVTFDVSIEIQQNQSDIVAQLIAQQGKSTLYENESMSDRDKLKKLIAYDITRVDCLTGERACFDIIAGGTFDDQSLAAKLQLSPLKAGRKYVYSICPMLRDASTLYDTLEVEKTYRGRVYKQKPSVHLHPTTLRTGAIASAATRSKNSGSSQFEYGRVGQEEYFEITIPDIRPTILSSRVVVKKKKITISWELSNTSRSRFIDHIQIYRYDGGLRELIGSATSNLQQSFDIVISDDHVGQMIFGLRPVYDDYELGKEVRTEPVIVGAEL